jgi:hypothetical protein
VKELKMPSKEKRSCWEWLVPVGVGVAMLGTVVLLTPLPQDPDYHDFADARTLLGIPHFWNVVSNLPFLVVGFAGMIALARGRLVLDDGTRPAFFTFFLGVALTGFGSSYYHLHPTNERLLWDRLSMAISFMSLLAAVLGERTRPPVARLALGPLLLIGVGSVLWWFVSERRGEGNLRPYITGQISPLVMIGLLLLLRTARYTRGYDYFIAGAWYGLAVVLEDTDGWVYHLLGQIGGHPLKHVAAAVGLGWVLRMLRLRRAL